LKNIKKIKNKMRNRRTQDQISNSIDIHGASRSSNTFKIVLGAILFFGVIGFLALWIILTYEFPQSRRVPVDGAKLMDNVASETSQLLATRPIYENTPSTPYGLVPKGPRYGWYNQDQGRYKNPYGYSPKTAPTEINSYWQRNSTGWIDYKNDVYQVKTLKNGICSECFRCGIDGFFVDKITSDTANFTNIYAQFISAYNSSMYIATITNLFSTSITTQNLTTDSLTSVNIITTNFTTTNLYSITFITNDLITNNLNAQSINTNELNAINGTFTGQLNVEIISVQYMEVAENLTVNHLHVTGMNTLIVDGSSLLNEIKGTKLTISESVIGYNMNMTGQANFTDASVERLVVGSIVVTSLVVNTPNGSHVIGDGIFNGTQVITGTLISYGSVDGNLFRGISAEISGDVTIGTTGLYTSALKTNKITPNSINDNLIINPQNGRVLFQTSVNHAVEFQTADSGALNTNWISTSAYTINSNRTVVTGTLYVQVSSNPDTFEWQPTIGGHNIGYSAWAPFWIQPNGLLVIGSASEATASINSNKVYIVGNTETTGIFRAASIISTSTISGPTITASTALRTNLITSISANDNLIIDASGTGRILFQTLTNRGVEFENINTGTANGNWISTSSYTAGSDRALVSGTIVLQLTPTPTYEWRPTIGGHTIDYLFWAPLWINPSDVPVIMGDVTLSTSQINLNKLYIVGNTETTGIFRAASIISTGAVSGTTFTASSTISGTIITASTSIRTNLIMSVSANDNLVIDAQGTGRILFQTLTNHGVEFENTNTGTSNTHWISTSSYTTSSDRALVSGTFVVELTPEPTPTYEWRPTIGGHTTNYLFWTPIWINPGPDSPIIMGNSLFSTSQINLNKLYVVGNTETTGILRANNIIVTTGFAIGGTDVIRLSSGKVILGSITIETNTVGTNGYVLTIDGAGNANWIAPSTNPNAVTAAGTLTLDTLVVGDGGKAVKSGIAVNTIVTHAAPLSADQVMFGDGSGASKTDSRLAIASGKLEATIPIHSTGNVETDGVLKLNGATLTYTASPAPDATITFLGNSGTVMIDNVYHDRLKLMSIVIPEFAVTGTNFHERALVPVYEINGLSFSGTCVYNNNGLNGNWNIQVYDINGQLLAESGAFPGNSLTQTNEEIALASTTSTLSTYPFISIVVHLSGYVSGSFTLRACRLNPIGGSLG
jgi:hypothetical protein